MNGKLDPEERVLSRNFTVYSKDGCPYCEKVEQVLKMTGLNFVIYKLDKHFDREGFISEFGEGSTFPQVVVNGKKTWRLCSNCRIFTRKKSGMMQCHNILKRYILMLKRQ